MSKSKKIGHFFTYVLKSVRYCKIERTGIGIGKARRMGRIAERVARTDAAHALRLVSAVNDVAVAQQIAQDQRRRQPRTVEPEGFEKRGVEGKGVAEPLLAGEGVEHLPRRAALTGDPLGAPQQRRFDVTRAIRAKQMKSARLVNFLINKWVLVEQE